MYLSCIAFTFLMTLSADLFGEKEIIFPEAAAIAAGLWLAPKMPWKTDLKRIFLLISFNAFIGTLTTAFLPVPIYIKAAIMMIMSFAEMAVFKTSFAPIISAAVLPVYLGTASLVYPISAVILAGIAIMGRLIFEKAGLLEKNEFTAVRTDKKYYLNRAFCLAAALLIMLPPITFGKPFYAAPPLLVGFAELCSPDSKARKNPIGILAIIGFAAICGEFSRFFLAQKLGLPLALCTLAAAALVFGAMSVSGIYFPPAAAAAVLPMIIGEKSLSEYAFQLTAGFAVMTAVSLLAFRDEKIQSSDESECSDSV